MWPRLIYGFLTGFPGYWDAAYGEARMVTWPLLVMTTATGRPVRRSTGGSEGADGRDRPYRREAGSMGTIINPSQDIGT